MSDPENDNFVFSANYERLDWRLWIIVIAVLAGISVLMSRIWCKLETFNPEEDFRVPYQLSEDYWVLRRWGKSAVKSFPALAIGDSVFWGQYTRPKDSLAEQLNRITGKKIFANFGVDGLHPAALEGLLRYHLPLSPETKVLVNFNLLWLSSANADLSTENESRFNHRKLVRQFLKFPPCYAAEFEQRLSAVLTRFSSAALLLDHIESVYWQNKGLYQWCDANPYGNPIAPFRKMSLPAPIDAPRMPARPWTATNSISQGLNMQWVSLEDSYQWQCFVRTLEKLCGNGNQVFILVSPFNTAMLSAENRGMHHQLVQEIVKKLAAMRLPFAAEFHLQNECFADASHPLADGYYAIAEKLLTQPQFKELFLEANDD